MLDKKQLDFLRALCETQTPSGREIEGQRLVAKYIEGFADEIRLDPLGNLHAVKNPGAPFRVVIDAHCDENGLLVQYVDDRGFLFFSLVGGVNRQLLPGERVLLMGPKGGVSGVIGRKPPHLRSQKEKDSGVGEIDELWIDIGARDKAEAMQFAPPGTFGTADAPFRRLCGTRASARAFDDRCGVFVIMEALRRLKGPRPRRRPELRPRILRNRPAHCRRVGDSAADASAQGQRQRRLRHPPHAGGGAGFASGHPPALHALVRRNA